MLVSLAPIDVSLIPGVLACEPRDQPHRRPEPIFSREERQIHLAEVVRSSPRLVRSCRCGLILRPGVLPRSISRS